MNAEKVDEIEVEGYKGLEGLNLSPKNVNLITGRNNTGKTSFLEALELLYDPKRVNKYRGNIDSLINRDFQQATITGSIGSDSEEVVIRPIQPENTRDYMIRALKNSLFRRDLLRERISDLTNHLEPEIDEEELASDIEEVFEEVIQDNITEEDLAKMKENFLVVEVEGKTHIFYDTGALRPIIDKRKDIREEIVNHNRLANYEQILDHHHFLDDFIFRYHRGGGFLSQPASKKGLNFIDSADIDIKAIEKEEEKNAIKIDDIGDFIKQKRILDDLKTFDLDSLVFEDDEGKYQIPFEFMGDGFKAIVGFLWQLIDDQENNVVLVEEPENHMHPGYIKELVSFLIHIAKDEEIQLFITTHDNDFINEFFSDNLEDGEKKFLRENMKLFQFKPKNAIEGLEYKEAKEHLKELQIDLRGL